MEKVFIYWDNSNIFIGAREAAVEHEGDDTRWRVRLHFGNLLRLAHAGRPVERAIAVGSVPPELRMVWNRLEAEGVNVELFERGEASGREQGVDQALQTHMLRHALDYNGDPGIVVLMTGDGAGFYDGVGFHADIERMHMRGWRIEVLSWRDSCNSRMRKWVESRGLFVALDDHYDGVTFLAPAAAGAPLAASRSADDVDLAKRPISPLLQP